jgi:hypothetical protein
LFIYVFVEIFVAIEDSVPNRKEGRIVSDILRVMEGMVTRNGLEWKNEEGRAREVISRMAFCCLDDTHGVPSESRDHVHVGTKNQRSSNCRQEISEEVLQGMSILGGDTDSNDMSVVNLVNMLVQEGGVQSSVRHREKEIFTHHTEDQSEPKSLSSGNLVNIH